MCCLQNELSCSRSRGWAGILGLGSLGSDRDICNGGLQLHGEKASPAKRASHEPGGEAASAVSSEKKPLWLVGLLLHMALSTNRQV